MGVATADFGFAAVAAAAGGAAGAALASHETEIRIVAALALAAIALHGLVAVARESASAAPGAVAAGGIRAHYARFLAITAANPLTIASFAAVAAALTLDGPVAAAAFAAGVGAASAGWHLVLTLAAGHAGRWITPGIRRGLAIGGRLVVLAIAAHLALRLARFARSAGAVERVERRHRLRAEAEVEHLGVLGDPLAPGGLRDHRDLALERPAQQHLRGRAAELLGDAGDGRMAEVVAAGERAVGLEHDVQAAALVQQRAAVLERGELDLVDVRRDARRARPCARAGRRPSC